MVEELVKSNHALNVEIRKLKECGGSYLNEGFSG